MVKNTNYGVAMVGGGEGGGCSERLAEGTFSLRCFLKALAIGADMPTHVIHLYPDTRQYRVKYVDYMAVQ
jgi:hypothetical protein